MTFEFKKDIRSSLTYTVGASALLSGIMVIYREDPTSRDYKYMIELYLALFTILLALSLANLCRALYVILKEKYDLFYATALEEVKEEIRKTQYGSINHDDV